MKSIEEMNKVKKQWIKRFIAWWNKKSFWCRIGFHSYPNEDKKIDYDRGTGQYIGGEEIIEKWHYYTNTCDRKNCNKIYWSPNYQNW